MPILLDGKKVQLAIKEDLKEKISQLTAKPCLVIVQIGDDARSAIYIKRKKEFGEAINSEVRHQEIPETVTQNEIEKIISDLNHDASVHGIIVQLPIPKHLDKEKILQSIDPVKDVDGLSSDTPIHTPATARGIMSLIAAYEIAVKGKKVVVVGRSKLVGAPIAQCLTNAGAEVVTCHKETPNIPDITKAADIIVVAAGSPKLITADYVRPGQVVIDVGINSVREEGDAVSYLVGDVDFDKVKDIVAMITPVPGGVGPLTVASLFANLVDAFQH